MGRGAGGGSRGGKVSAPSQDFSEVTPDLLIKRIEADQENNTTPMGYPILDAYGLRSVTPNPKTGEAKTLKVGDKLKNSYHWEDGNSTGKKIDGVSTLGIDHYDVNPTRIEKAIKGMKDYKHGATKQIVLVGGKRSRGGDDPGEKIITDAVVLAVWSLKKL
jgi:hypothetical protein